MHALDVFNRAGDPLQPTSSATTAIQIGDPLLIPPMSIHEKQKNERRDIVETAVAAAIATLNHHSSTSNIHATLQREPSEVSSISTNAISARPPLPPQNPSTSRIFEYHIASPQTPSTSTPEQVTEKSIQEVTEDLRKQHSPAGEAAAEAASALLSETFGGHQQDWGQTIFSSETPQQDEGNVVDVDDIQQEEESTIQTEMVEEESISGDFY